MKKSPKKLHIGQFTLQDLAIFFAEYHNRRMRITFGSDYIDLVFRNEQLPHIVGLQYAYKDMKNASDYSGVEGYKKMLSGYFSYKVIQARIRKRNLNDKSGKRKITWQDVEQRITYLPYFMIQLEKGNTRLVSFDKNNVLFDTAFGGDYLIFKFDNKKYLNMSIKKVGKHFEIESFFVNETIMYLGNQIEHEVSSINWIS